MASSIGRSALKILNKPRVSTVSIGIRKKSTENNILTSVYKDIPVSNYTVNDFVWQNLDRWPDKTATVSSFYVYACLLRHKKKWFSSFLIAVQLKNKKVSLIKSYYYLLL